MRRGDQPPFRARGGAAATLEAIAAAVELGVGEDRLDHALAFGVELAAAVGREHASHERVQTAVPAGPGALAFASVGRDQHHGSAAAELLDLDLMPVAGVGEHNLQRLADPSRGELGLGGRDHRPEMPEVR